MFRFAVSQEALSDLKGIVRYTTRKWGAEQARRYVAEFENCFELLAKFPGSGRACDSISPGLRRHEQGKHVVFYRELAGGVRVIRVLHQQMVPDSERFPT